MTQLKLDGYRAIAFSAMSRSPAIAKRQRPQRQVPRLTSRCKMACETAVQRQRLFDGTDSEFCRILFQR